MYTTHLRGLIDGLGAVPGMARLNRATRWGLPTLLLGALLGASMPVLAVSHFIVLFDASGSVKKQHEKSDNLWEGKTGDNAHMATIVRKLVDKAINEIPDGFPSFHPENGDILSFVLFRTDLYNPSYDSDHLFLTNSSLVDWPGLPSSSAYERFDQSPIRGVTGDTIELKDALTGHSPLQAATTASLPFFASSILRYGKVHGGAVDPVDKTVIIRITDGDYNTEATGADEHNVISKTAARYRKDDGVPASGADDGFAAHQALTRAVDRLFDIGARQADCAFPTHTARRWQQSLDCRANAYDEVKGYGEGFLISYMTVDPKSPALAGLARTEKTRVSLDTVYRLGNEGEEGGVRLTGENRIFAHDFTDPQGRFRFIPRQPEWHRDGAAWQPCEDPDATSGTVNCGPGGPRLDFAVDQVPESLEYQVGYLMDFLAAPNLPLLYPYQLNLGTVPLPRVTLDIKPIDEHVVELTSQGGSGGGWLDFGLLRSDAGIEGHRVDLTAANLADYASRWRDDLVQLAKTHGAATDVFTPRLLAQLSSANQLAATQRHVTRALHAWITFLTLLGVVIGGPLAYWLLWPRRELQIRVQNHASEGLLVDFNDRRHERPELVAMMLVLNGRRNPFFTAGFGRFHARLIRHDLSPVEGVIVRAVRLEQREDGAAPLALGGLRKSELKERHVSHGKELPVYFDSREIKDLSQPAGPIPAVFDIPARIDVDAARVNSDNVAETFRVTVIPERGELQSKSEGLSLDHDQHLHREIEYDAGETRAPLCTYNLRSSARHHYSAPVKGELQIEVRDRADRVIEGAVNLVAEDAPARCIGFYLRYGEPMQVDVVLDFARLGRNPIERDDYRVVIQQRETNGEPVTDVTEDLVEATPPSPWLPFDQWRLDVKRAAGVTDVSMVLVENDRLRSEALNTARRRLDAPFHVGSPQRPRPVMPQAQQGQNFAKLFVLRLSNACRNGHGHADWHARIEISAHDGIEFPTQALRLVDERDHDLAAGRLVDSPDNSEREIDLIAKLELRDATIMQRDHRVEVAVTVEWQVSKREPASPDAVERFETHGKAICHLRHEPPRDVLAIDFGTSAMAIAHAMGPTGIELLRLPDRLTRFEEETNLRRRWDDPDKRNPYFLASEFNVCLKAEKLAETRPDEPDFLDLPLAEQAVYGQPDLCFSSLKALMSQGFTELPLDPRTHPYLNSEGEVETRRSPALDKVIEGAYRGLLQHFIEPIFAKPNKGYSHVYITHPNTYTQNHVQQLRGVIEEVFRGVARGHNIVYPDNIHFVSESDAVAYYYLLHAHELRAPDMAVPDREHILVYDIGAGTLDLTYLDVDWKRDPGGGYTPKHIRVVRRGGVTKAGDLLDECIARDLHAYLDSVLDEERYLTRIVVDGEETMEEAEMRRMDSLRQQIHKLKADLSAGAQNPSLRLSTTEQGAARLLATKAQATPELYQGCDQLRATEKGEVFWEPGRERLLNGRFVGAFVERVTRDEVINFTGGSLQRPDTVILSGRTSLWPGFRDRLAETLGDIPNWVTFDGNADDLKRVVVLGVIQREFYWRNIDIEQPKVPGVFGVRYERQVGDWVFAPYQKSGDRQEFYLQNASEVQVGLKTNNGFHVCNAFLPDRYYSDDRKLFIQLDYDDDGYLRVKVANTLGDGDSFGGVTSIPTLSYRRRPWPLGASKLQTMTPEQLLGVKGENA